MGFVTQRAAGNKALIGLMLESYLNEGNQPVSADLKYGVSVTDACVDFDTTVSMLRTLSQAVSRGRIRQA